MNEISKTTGFVLFAAAMLGLAGWTWNSNLPTDAAGFENQGKPFFPDLDKPELELQALEIHALDGEGNPQEFIVRKKDGVWSIPSHYGYPAEAADRLANSMAAMVGLVRQAVDSQSRSDHEKRGVLDPLDPEVLVPEAAGKRITIKGAGDVILADLIIGKKVESTGLESPTDRPANRPHDDLYFVRAANETTIYRIPVNLDISTRFSDWINTTLLELGESAPLNLTLDNYAIVEQKDQLGRILQLVKKPAERLVFSRPDPIGEWQLAGLRPDIEKIKTQDLNSVLQTAESLMIRGVRPKFTWQGEQLITADLKLNRSEKLLQDPRSFQQAILQLQDELAERGFNLIPGEGGPENLSLVADNGELELGCDNGLKYTLYFGKSVSGDEKAIEIGDSAAEISATELGRQPDGNSAAPAANEDSVSAEGDSSQSGDESKDSAPVDDGNNRFVMIRVSIDETLLGAAPVAPVEPRVPTKPEGYVPAPPKSETGGGDGGEKSEVVTDTRDPAFVEYDRLLAEFEPMKNEYELEMMRYTDETASLTEKRQAATSRSTDLNVRFGAWYYVVSAQNLEKLRANRVDLVVPVIPNPNKPPVNLPDVPDISFGGQ